MIVAKSPIAACRRILERSGSSFATAFRILPSEQRDAVTAFYAFCRKVDDEVDDADDVRAAGEAVSRWRERIEALFRGEARDPVCQALLWAAQRFGIKPEHLDLILQGVEQDLHVNRYETFADLYEYCYKVASAVGLVCVSIVGELAAETELYAELSGIAVQLTNIIRDVREDLLRGRIYLPLEDLARFGVCEGDLTNRGVAEPVKKLLRFEALRAMHFYDLSSAALPPGAKHRLFFTEALRETYHRLLEKIIDGGFECLYNRVSVSSREKISIALRRRLHPATFLSRLTQ